MEKKKGPVGNEADCMEMIGEPDGLPGGTPPSPRKTYAKLSRVEPLTRVSGKIAVYPADDVDTDRIIPALYLSRVSRFGYGELLFRNVRGGDFPLDAPEAQGAVILVAGSNFGCGSSREHAVWAIQQAGFRAVIGRKKADSPAFSDIFRQNAANCGLLLVDLPEDQHQVLVDAGSGASAEVDLERQEVIVGSHRFKFEIAPATRNALLKGLDLIGTTLELEDRISSFERSRRAFQPPETEPVP